MSAQPSTDRPDVPSATSDGFVRGLSQFIGGPLGSHATRPDARPNRFWTAPRFVLALTCLILALSWAYLHHFLAGIRHLFMDMHYLLSKDGSRNSAVTVLALSLFLTLLVALKLFGVF